MFVNNTLSSYDCGHLQCLVRWFALDDVVGCTCLESISFSNEEPIFFLD